MAPGELCGDSAVECVSEGCGSAVGDSIVFFYYSIYFKHSRFLILHGIENVCYPYTRLVDTENSILNSVVNFGPLSSTIYPVVKSYYLSKYDTLSRL